MRCKFSNWFSDHRAIWSDQHYLVFWVSSWGCKYLFKETLKATCSLTLLLNFNNWKSQPDPIANCYCNITLWVYNYIIMYVCVCVCVCVCVSYIRMIQTRWIWLIYTYEIWMCAAPAVECIYIRQRKGTCVLTNMLRFWHSKTYTNPKSTTHVAYIVTDTDFDYRWLF